MKVTRNLIMSTIHWPCDMIHNPKCVLVARLASVSLNNSIQGWKHRMSSVCILFGIYSYMYDLLYMIGARKPTEEPHGSRACSLRSRPLGAKYCIKCCVFKFKAVTNFVCLNWGIENHKTNSVYIVCHGQWPSPPCVCYISSVFI